MDKKTKSSERQGTLEQLELRLKTILPEEYQDHYEDVQPLSMGSASLKYGPDGKVAWNEIWDSFCDLAMAGGPPHKGSLLEPGSQAEIEAAPDRYAEVVGEIRRGILMTTELESDFSSAPGWIRVECLTEVTAEWLVRAIVMENVSAWRQDRGLFLPASPSYRVEKEVKNVITAISKTSHYWLDHVWSGDQRIIAKLFAEMEAQSPLLTPLRASRDLSQAQYETTRQAAATKIRELTGLRSSEQTYLGWLGVDCPDIRAAIWIMRALVASNVLSRREGTLLFVPINPVSDPEGEIVARLVHQTYRFAKDRKIL